MSKGNGFLGSLKKSTRITILSCSLFVLFTVAIMVFFVFFPITPSENVIAGFGRENVAKNNSPAVTTVTTAAEELVLTKASTTTTVSKYTTKHTNYVIIATTGEGFYVSNVIPTGVSPYDWGSYTATTSTTSAVESTSYEGTGYEDTTDYSIDDPGYSYTDPNEQSTDYSWSDGDGSYSSDTTDWNSGY